MTPHLQERISRLSEPRPEGTHILYWMRTAVRGHDNPALDVAITLANESGLPVLVYHAISERYPYASDRHHTFLLQGARDVAAELAERGVPYVLHVERPGHRGPHLHTLAAGARVVITEDMPVAPLLGWTRSLAEAHPVWVVDTACIVPMPLVGRAFTRAFAFRQATEPLRAGRLDRVWTDVPLTVLPGRLELPFEPVDTITMDIAALVAEADIDHSVGPVPDTVGGSVAGYARWDWFREHALKSYSARRNNAADPYGVSRMSAYLHMGFVSPFRIAREVEATAGKGASKYLDELLVWRELAYHYCRFEPRHGHVDALPEWARATLKRHESDPRQLLGWETLARGRTGDALWDLAQRSLLIHGELHNNVRMTWGKAVAGWTVDAAEALSTLLDLNHRYALDGRDPASYGGILWALGGFDRPFKPARPVLGEVRGRGTADHARRLDMEAYATHIAREPRPDPPRYAVIGGGVAGMAAARTLADGGYEVVVFDKGRGAGGRLSTRRREQARYDHGAPAFTARHPTFLRYVESWTRDGIVAPWPARAVEITDGGTTLSDLAPRWVGTPSMNALVKHLGADLDVRFGQRVTALTHNGSWQVQVGDRIEAFDGVVLAVPAPQAADLLDSSPGLQQALGAVEVDPCWAVMVELDSPASVDWDYARIRNSPLGWAMAQGSKPGREPGNRWVLHASADWTRAHLEDEAAEVCAALSPVITELLGAPIRDITAHRWRYARVTTAIEASHDPRGLVLAGDAVSDGRIEAAFLSGHRAAGRLLMDAAVEAPSRHREQLGLFG